MLETKEDFIARISAISQTSGVKIEATNFFINEAPSYLFEQGVEWTYSVDVLFVVCGVTYTLQIRDMATYADVFNAMAKKLAEQSHTFVCLSHATLVTL